MGDQDDRGGAEALLKPGADLRVRLGVDRGERVVKDHDRCVARERARDRSALLLSAGERNAALADEGIISLGKALDRLIETGGSRRSLDAGYVRSVAGDGDVLADRTGEKERLLQDDADMFTQPVGLDLADVDAADGDRPLPLFERIELVEKIHHCGLAAARAPEDAERRARFHRKADVLQHRRTVFIGKRHMFEYNIAADLGRQRVGRILLDRRVHDIADTFDRNAGLAHLGDHTPKHADRPHQHRVIGDKGHIFAGLHPPADAEDRAKDDDQHHLRAGEHVGGAPEAAHDRAELFPQRGIVFVLRLEFVLFKALAAKRTHDAYARQVFLRHGRELALVLIAVHEALAELGVEMKRVGDDEGHRDKGDQRQRNIHREHEDQAQDQHDKDAENIRQLLGDKVLHRVDIRGTALDDVAGAVLHVPGKRQMLNMGKRRVAHGLDQRLGRLGVAHAKDILARHLDSGNDHHAKRHDPQMLTEIRKAADRVHAAHDPGGKLRRLSADGVVDGGADDLRRDHIGQGRQRGAKHADEEKPFAPLQEAPHQRPGRPILLSFFCFFHKITKTGSEEFQNVQRPLLYPLWRLPSTAHWLNLPARHAIMHSNSRKRGLFSCGIRRCAISNAATRC